MKAVILAAGVASRLRPLTDSTPKCLLKVGTKSILERTIDNLIMNNVSEVIVVTGYLKEMVESFLTEKYPEINFKFIFNSKYNTTNNIYSLWLAKREILGYDMLLLDSDIVFDGRIVSLLINSEKENVLALRKTDNLGEEEIKCALSEKGFIKEISKTVNITDAVGESIGIELFSDKLVYNLFTILDRKILDEKQVDIFYEAAFQEAINSGAEIYPIKVGNYKCMEIDTPDDFEKAAELVESMG